MEHCIVQIEQLVLSSSKGLIHTVETEYSLKVFQFTANTQSLLIQ